MSLRIFSGERGTGISLNTISNEYWGRITVIQVLALKVMRSDRSQLCFLSLSERFWYKEFDACAKMFLHFFNSGYLMKWNYILRRHDFSIFLGIKYILIKFNLIDGQYLEHCKGQLLVQLVTLSTIWPLPNPIKKYVGAFGQSKLDAACDL